MPASNYNPVEKSHHASLTTYVELLKRRDAVFNQSEKGIKSKIDILKLILTNLFFHAHNLSVKHEENNGLLAGVPFLSPSRAQIPPSSSPFNACHAGYRPHGTHC